MPECVYPHQGEMGVLVALLRSDCYTDISRYELVSHRFSSKLWRVVINVSDSDDGGGSVGEAVHGVALHVGGLNDQRVLRHFLERKTKKKEM